MRFNLLIVLIGFCLPCISQTKTIRGEKINVNSTILNEQFKKWEIYSIPSTELHNRTQIQDDNIQVQLNLGNRHQWNLLLHPNDMRSDTYQIQSTEGKNPPRQKNKTFAGYEFSSQGKSVRLTIDDNFIYGYIEKDNERWFIEPMHYFEPDAPADAFVVYAEKNVIHKEGKTCGVTEMNDKTKELNHDHHHDAPEVVGQCYTVEMAIASDFAMFQKYGSITGVENHNLGVMNNVQGNYDDEFADEIIFSIVTQFVSNCASCDPWSATTDASDLLASFRTWGNGGNFSVTYDVAQLWTDRDLAGSTVGIAYVGAICTNSRYHVLQDFTSNANSLRVMTAHELGHNFDYGHDSGSGFIMSPSVNNTTTWSTASLTVINSFITNLSTLGNCLTSCAPPAPPTAGIGVSHQSICPGSTVQFFDQSQNNPLSWSWQFPGGQPSSSNEANPVVTYNNPGTYTAVLTAANANGADVASEIGIVTVGNNGSAVLLFESFENGLGSWTVSNPDNSNTWSTSNVGGALLGDVGAYMDNWSYQSGVGQRDGLVSAPINLVGYGNVFLQMEYGYALWSGGTSSNDSLIIYASSDGGNSYARLFQDADDGFGNFATTQPLSSEFFPGTSESWCFGGNYGASCLSVDLSQFAGQPNVIIKIENFSKYGNNLFVDNISVLSSCQQVFVPPVSAFVSGNSIGCAPHTVQFTDMSQNSPTAWSWQFPGGTPSTSNLQNPIVTYSSSGIFDVTLTVTNGAGENTAQASNYVIVDESPFANFTFTNTGSTFSFNNISTGNGSYVWNFGDGNTSTDMNPVHTYATGGTYTVNLLATNSCGSTTFVSDVTVSVAPTASFTASPLSGCGPLNVQFNDLSIGGPTQWTWQFPGGIPSTSNDQNPQVTYDAAGTYEVTLEVANQAGQNAFTLTDYITVSPLATASFTSNISGNTANFNNTSTNANSYNWDFGDGTFSTDAAPVHTYNSDGTFTVSMTATNDCGSVTTTETITISTAPTATFLANVTNGCVPMTVQFSNQSSANVTSWTWNFPGGIPSTSTDPNPTVVYNTAGIYGVTLVVMNSTGVSSIAEQSNYIVINDVPTANFTSSINGTLASFSNNSTNATSYSWDFGDGNTSTDASPSHTYNSDGTYTVSMTVMNGCGATTTTETITITTAPTAAFSSNMTSGCAPMTIVFSNQSSANAVSWNWSFPGGTPSTSPDANPMVTYNSAGTYGVTLEVTNATGISSMIEESNYIVINDVPTANFTSSINGTSASFSNNSTNANSYSWDFGDGNTSTDTSPSHTYNSDGSYAVSMTVMNDCGSVTTTETITITTAPTAAFSSNMTSGCAPMTITFSNQSSANAVSWNWSFPGGTPSTSTDANPTVSYSTAGMYGVTLEVTNATGISSMIEESNYIVINDVPTANFTSSINGTSALFSNSSTNANSYSWDFGDGNTSTDTSPSHTYNSDGSYAVSMTVMNDCGSVTTTETITITTAPTAAFSSNMISGCAPMTIVFSNQSSANAVSWNWSFPGGTPSTSTDANPTVSYSTAGTYGVTLEVTNATGISSMIEESNYIVINDVPTANFTSSINGTSASFSNSSTNANSYSWDFGDGNTSTDTSPSHTYNSDGSYTVSMTVMNDCGSVTTTETITITTAPTAAFSSNMTSGCAPMTITFSNQSSANAVSWNWSFPGGTPSTSTDANPMVTYNSAGTFGVTLEVTNATGISSMIEESNYIVINDVPTANFTSSINGTSASFNNNSTNANSYSWDFGDGNTSTDTSPSHTYNSDGSYTVSMTVMNDCGSVTTTETITITTAPTAAFSSNMTSGCAPMMIAFSNQSSANAVSWNWSFPGGTPSTSTDANPMVTYNSAGTYGVTLEVTNATGISSMIEESNYIVINDVPTANFTSSINGTSASFSNSSTNANSYSWDFGDGNTSTDTSPSHTYNSDGSYTVSMTVTNDCGSVTTTETITITTAPTAAFLSNLTSGCAPMTIVFSNQSSANAISWNWSFPGGTPSTSTDANPMVTYNSAGTYGVTLEVTNATGVSSMIEESNYIVINDVPTANFTSSINGTSASFSNSSTNANSYSWDFGDGNTSTEMEPSHNYSVDGDYEVILTATNDCGTITSAQNISIATAPTAGFSTNINSGCTPLEVTFQDESSSNTIAWNWEFPGGTPSSSSEQNPVVVYNNAGTYAATLTSTNPQGSDVITVSDVVVVNTTPLADFSFDVNGPMVSFTNNSDDAANYAWDFGDGNTSTEENPTYQYSVNGNYTVVLNATNDCGTTTTTQMVSITSSVIAAFTSNISEGCSPLVVQFEDQSINATAWEWTFVGGVPSSSSEQNPVITFSNPGIFTVELNALNATGNSTITETGFVIVNSVPFVTLDPIINGLTVDFSNMTTGGETYFWDFGDGNTSTEESPQHTYNDIGVYNVTIIATNDCGASEITFTVDVGTAIAAGFNSNVVTGCESLEVQFMDNSTGVVTNWNWTFPGGTPSTSTEQNPIVTYNTQGSYEVILEVGNGFNTNETVTSNYIVVEAAPSANFSSVINLSDVTFTNNSADATSYLWDFGDGNTSDSPTPLHSYSTDGTYLVVLTATNDCGSTTFEQTVEIVTPVNANFEANMTSGCIPMEIQFSDLSSENSSSWNWTFDGGTPSSSTEQNPTIVYNTPGIYTVTLEVSNSQFSDIQTITDYVIIETVPEANFTSDVSGLEAIFTNMSNSANTYEWQFGDGNISTDENPTHTYADAGSYTVTLIATNDCGSNTSTFEVTTVAVPTANFVSDITSGCLPLVVQFTDQSSSNVTDWAWTFENGSPSTSTLENPEITFNTPGVHNVTLVASNGAGTSTSSMQIVVNAPPSPAFTSDVNSLLVDFENQTTGATSYVWDFGDGNTSTDENPQHVYEEGGIYVVVLTATNDCGSVMTVETIEVIGPLTIAAFNSSASGTCAPVTVNFTDISSNNPTAWSWEFPGGTPSSSAEQNPTIVYDTPGTYDVILIASNFAGSNTVSQTAVIVVEASSPVANFVPTISGQGSILLQNTSTDGTQFEWLFGDGNTSTEENPSHTYDSTGTYDVTLIVTNNCGTDTITQEVSVVITSNDDIGLLEKFDLYPNPNNGEFILHLEGLPTKDLQLNLYNILGQEIHQEELDFSNGKIIKTYHFQNLAAATYILQIRSEGKMMYKKVMVE